MNKKIIVTALALALSSTSAFAIDINKHSKIDLYGNIGATYVDSEDLFYTETSHLNADGIFQFNKKHSIKANVGYRSYFSKTEDNYVSDIYLDEIYYHFEENDVAELKLGRFYNPVGMYGKTPFDYTTHPFSVRNSFVTSIDGLSVGYTSELQKNVFVVFDAFIGTQLSDSIINGQEVNFDTSFNYGANTKFYSPFGNLNLGLYASNNGTGLEINGIDKGITEDPLFYQTNIGYEFNRGNIYFLAEYNRNDYNYDDEEDKSFESADITLAYTYWKFTPMIGYTIEESNQFLQLSNTDKEILKAGLRFDFNEKFAIMTEAQDITDNINSEDEMLIKTDVSFKF